MIGHKPASNWWVKHVLKKRNRIVASIRKQQTIYLKKSHKEVPKAFALDAKNDTTSWADAISKELENAKVEFELVPDGKKA